MTRQVWIHGIAQAFSVRRGWHVLDVGAASGSRGSTPWSDLMGLAIFSSFRPIYVHGQRGYIGLCAR